MFPNIKYGKVITNKCIVHDKVLMLYHINLMHNNNYDGLQRLEKNTKIKPVNFVKLKRIQVKNVTPDIIRCLIEIF